MNAMPVDSYARLVAALRDRVAELNIPFESVDRIAGLPERYASKLLAEWPGKGMGAISFFPILQALGLRLKIEPDDELLAKLRRRSDWIEVVRRGTRYRVRREQPSRRRHRARW